MIWVTIRGNKQRGGPGFAGSKNSMSRRTRGGKEQIVGGGKVVSRLVKG